MAMGSGNRWTRRDFLKRSWLLGAGIGLAANRAFPAQRNSPGPMPEREDFRWRSVALAHLPEVRSWLERLDRAGRLSNDRTWRSYIDSFQFEPPPQAAGARSLIILSLPLRVATMTFHTEGGPMRLAIPAGYVDDGRTLEDYRNLLRRAGIAAPGDKLERARLPLKLLAVRSGLAAYGRNNLAYVDGYGSLHQLLAFYSLRSPGDTWRPLRLMAECKGCSLCQKNCPTGAIRTGTFILDPARCLTLFNERPSPLPAWIPPTAHNALVGCLKCQSACPANEEGLDETWDLGTLDRRETAALLTGKTDATLATTLKQRLSRISGGDDLAYIGRNLRLLLAGGGGGTGQRS